MVSGTESTASAKEIFTSALAASSTVEYLTELRRASDLISDQAVAEALTAAKVPSSEKLKLLSERAGKFSPGVAALMTTLLDKGRLAELEDITLEYQRLLDAYHGVEGAEVAEITTAVPLDEPARLSLGKRLTEILGKPIVVKADVDPGLIGGIIIRVGDKLIDGSIRSRLQTLSKELAT